MPANRHLGLSTPICPVKDESPPGNITLAEVQPQQFQFRHGCLTCAIRVINDGVWHHWGPPCGDLTPF
jgi:hypothetical protein